MAEITINGVKYTNVPNKKAGTKFSSPLTQSNIGVSQAVQDYVNSSYFYPLVNAIDINWNGIEVDENTYINSTSDLVSYIATKSSDIDLSSYATVSYVTSELATKADANNTYTKAEVDAKINAIDLTDYATTTYVNQKIEDLVGAAPETLDTLEELAAALQNDATLSYVTQGLASKADLTYVTSELATKADVNNTYTKAEVDEKINAIDLSDYATTSYVTTELDKKADANNTYTKAEVDEKINAIDLSAYATNSQLDNRTLINGNSIITEFGTYNVNNLTQFKVNVDYQEDCGFYIDIYTYNDDHLQLFMSAGMGSADEYDYDNPNPPIIANLTEADPDIESESEWPELYAWDISLNTPIKSMTISADGVIFKFQLSYGSSITVIENFDNYVSKNELSSYNYATTTYVNEKINAIDLSGYATTSYVTTELATKADADNTYTKAEVDEKINAIDLSSYATISYVTGELDNKANKTDIVKADLMEMNPDSNSYILHNPFHYNHIVDNYLGTIYHAYNFIWPHNANIATTMLNTKSTGNILVGPSSLAIYNNSNYCLLVGRYVQTKNNYEVTFGEYNDSTYDSSNNNKTSFSVGNGTSTTKRHNAFEIRTNGYIYIADTKNGTPYILQDRLNGKADLSYVTSELANKANVSQLPDLSNYATTTYVTSELATKADADNTYTKAEVNDKISAIDLSNYVPLSSYNALAARVEELAQWIVSYHTPTPPTPTPTNPDIYFANQTLTIDYSMEPNKLNGTDITQYLLGAQSGNSSYIGWNTTTSGDSIMSISNDGRVTAWNNGTNRVEVNYMGYDNPSGDPNFNSYMTYYDLTIVNYGGGSSKQYPSGRWYDSNMNEASSIKVIAGDTTTYSFTFNGTPISGWSFYDPMMIGITVNQLTGEITVDPTNMNGYTNINISANYPEDQDYYYGNTPFNVMVIPQGSNPDFYYEEGSVNLSNNMPSHSPMLSNTLTGCDHVGYVSSDTAVATVDSMSGTIYYVSSGTCTVTATAYDSGNNVLATATISVYCTQSKPWASGSWLDSNLNPVYNMGVVSADTTTYTLSFSGTPASGWTFSDPSYAGITVNSSTGEITIDPTNMNDNNLVIINATYPEDMDYYSGMISITIRVLPTGSNPNFYYEQNSVSLDNGAMTAISPMLYNSLVHSYIDYTSSNTTVATVDGRNDMSPGLIHYAGAGTCTVTATAYDSNDMAIATATISVLCTYNPPSPSTYSFTLHGMEIGGHVTGITINGSPITVPQYVSQDPNWLYGGENDPEDTYTITGLQSGDVIGFTFDNPGGLTEYGAGAEYPSDVDLSGDTYTMSASNASACVHYGDY